jgi:hypothetical protein
VGSKWARGCAVGPDLETVAMEAQLSQQFVFDHASEFGLMATDMTRLGNVLRRRRGWSVRALVDRAT